MGLELDRRWRRRVGCPLWMGLERRRTLLLLGLALCVVATALPRFHDVLLSARGADPVLQHDCADALRRAARFLLKHRRLADVNIVYALRAVEGALGADAAGVRALVHALLPYARRRDPTFVPLEPLVSRAHRIRAERRVPFGRFGDLEDSPNSRAFSEHFSDKCMHELFAGCRVTDKCAAFMFTPATYRDYQTTHKALYFILYLRQGCGKDKAPPADPTAMLERQIVAMWEQAHHEVPKLETWLAHANDRHDDGQQLRIDIFRERIAIAAQEGFTQFLKPAWLRTIVSTQRKKGCWGAPCDIHLTAVSVMPLAAYLHFTNATHLV